MIQLDGVAIRQGQFHLAGVTLAVPAGQYGVLMGRTGSGKTTLLEAVAGLRPLAAGRVLLGGVDVTHAPPAARQVGYVPQDTALFPTMTVGEQLGFSLTIRREPPDAVARRVNELAEWLGVVHLLGRRPAGLSGGEAQRVALGRALAFRPRVLLLDEPLSALDEETRGQMVEVLGRVNEHEGVTVLHVTHNRAEAEQLGDVVFRL